MREMISLGWLELWVQIAGSKAPKEPSVQGQHLGQETPLNITWPQEGWHKTKVLRFHRVLDTELGSFHPHEYTAKYYYYLYFIQICKLRIREVTLSVA